MAEFEKLLRGLSGRELKLAAESLYNMLRPYDGEKRPETHRSAEPEKSGYSHKAEAEDIPAKTGKTPGREFLLGVEREMLSAEGEFSTEVKNGLFEGTELRSLPRERGGFSEGYMEGEEDAPSTGKLSAAAERLSAEAVSEYFRRDSRRYDSGFQRY